MANAQSAITGVLARTLHLELAEAVGRQIEHEKPVNLDARDLVMRGWALYYRPLSAGNREAAQRAFEQALEIDPESVDARVGIATVLGEYLALGWSKSRQQDMERDEKLLLEALGRDRNNSQALSTMGQLRRLQNRLIESQIELEKAIKLDPNHAGAILQLGITLMFLGQPDAAIPHIEKAILLNPRHQNIFYFYYWLGQCHLLLAHTDQAIDFLRKGRSANPQHPGTQMLLAAALGVRGDVNEARAILAEALKLKLWFKSIAQLHADAPPYMNNPQFAALREKTMEIGLRRAGMPEE